MERKKMLTIVYFICDFTRAKQKEHSQKVQKGRTEREIKNNKLQKQNCKLMPSQIGPKSKVRKKKSQQMQRSEEKKIERHKSLYCFPMRPINAYCEMRSDGEGF